MLAPRGAHAIDIDRRHEPQRQVTQMRNKFVNHPGRQFVAWMRQTLIRISPARLANRQRHPHIDFAHLAQLACGQQLLDRPDRPVEAIILILHDQSALRLCMIPQRPKLGIARRHRLLNDHMRPSVDAIRDDPPMRMRRRADMHHVILIGRQHLLIIGVRHTGVKIIASHISPATSIDRTRRRHQCADRRTGTSDAQPRSFPCRPRQRATSLLDRSMKPCCNRRFYRARA